MVSDFLADQRMQQGFEPAAFLRHFEDQLAQCRAIQLTIGLQHAGAEVFGNLRQCRTPRFHHPASGMIGVDHVDTQVDEVLGRRAFTAADAAGQAENPGFFHRGIHFKPTNCQ